MRDYLFVSQMPEKTNRVFTGSIARVLKLAAMYSDTPDKSEYVHIQRPYRLADTAFPAECSFYGIKRKGNYERYV